MEYVVRKVSGFTDRHELTECNDGKVRVLAAGTAQAVLAVARLFGVPPCFRDIYAYEAAEREVG